MRKRKLLLVAGTCLATLSLTVGSALADPTGNPATRILAGAGSDTTQDVMNSISNVPASGSRIIGSYDAVGSPNITTKIGTDCTIPRPVGSGNGVLALRDQRAAAAAPNPVKRPCLDFARSSADLSQDSRFNATGLTFVPFAGDSISYVTRRDSLLPTTLTRAQLKAIYECTAAGTINGSILPLIPQSGSGTRTSFLSLIGVTTLGACVSDRDPTNPSVGLIENTGNRLTDPKHIAPYSYAQYSSQAFKVINDVRGQAEIRRVEGFIPPNPAFPLKREVFNVIPTRSINVAPYNTTFVGGSSAVCSATNEILQNGFILLPSGRCGAIDPALQTPGGLGPDPGPPAN